MRLPSDENNDNTNQRNEIDDQSGGRMGVQDTRQEERSQSGSEPSEDIENNTEESQDEYESVDQQEDDEIKIIKVTKGGVSMSVHEGIPRTKPLNNAKADLLQRLSNSMKSENRRNNSGIASKETNTKQSKAKNARKINRNERNNNNNRSTADIHKPSEKKTKYSRSTETQSSKSVPKPRLENKKGARSEIQKHVEEEEEEEFGDNQLISETDDENHTNGKFDYYWQQMDNQYLQAANGSEDLSEEESDQDITTPTTVSESDSSSGSSIYDSSHFHSRPFLKKKNQMESNRQRGSKLSTPAAEQLRKSFVASQATIPTDTVLLKMLLLRWSRVPPQTLLPSQFSTSVSQELLKQHSEFMAIQKLFELENPK
jgi:hypothetical protein